MGKKRKQPTDVDEPATTSSPAPNLEQMSEKQRKKYVSEIVRKNKKLDADAKKTKASKVKSAEKQAEVQYAATERPSKKQKTAASATGSKSTAKKASAVPIKSKNTTRAKDSGTESDSEPSDVHSSVAYDSGKDGKDGEDKGMSAGQSNSTGNTGDIPIDPVLLAVDATNAAAASKKKTRAQEMPNAEKTKKTTSPATPTPGARGKGPATVTVGTAKPLGNTLKAPRTFQKGPIRPMTSSESDEDDSSTSDSSSSSDEDRASRALGNFTPYERPKIKDGRAFPALSAMSPTTRPRLEDARSRYSVWLATHDAFPSEKEARRAARGAMLTELDEVQRSCVDDSDVEEQQRIGRRVFRFHGQPVYKRDTTGITEGVDSTFRGHIVYDAESLVASEWKLDDLNEEECCEKVQNLLHKGNFAFADWEGEKRSGMFGCPVIPKLLRKAFLTKAVKKGLPLGLGENLPIFAEVPPALIAFLLTAIECVLRRWTTGTYNTNASHFTLTTYEPIYTRHLKALHQAQTRSPHKLDATRKQIWAAASRNIAGSAQATVIDDADGYMCDADFEDDDAPDGAS